MKKQFIVSDDAWPNLCNHDMPLMIDDTDLGNIEMVDLGSMGIAPRLHLFDSNFKLLPLVAADLYSYPVTKCYSVKEACLHVAGHLAANGWIDLTDDCKLPEQKAKTS